MEYVMLSKLSFFLEFCIFYHILSTPTVYTYIQHNIHICKHVYIFISIYVFIHHTYRCRHFSIYLSVYASVCTYIYILISLMIRVYMYIYIYIYFHIYIYTHIYMYIYVYIYIYEIGNILCTPGMCTSRYMIQQSFTRK